MISSLISFTIDSFYSSYIKIFEISSKSRTSRSFDFFFVDILFVILRIQKFPNFFPSFTIDRDRSSFLIVLHTQKFLNFKISPNIENESILRHLFRRYPSYPKFFPSNIDPSPIFVTFHDRSIFFLRIQKFPKFLLSNIDPSPISFTIDRSILFRAFLLRPFFIPKNFFYSSSILRQKNF